MTIRRSVSTLAIAALALSQLPAVFAAVPAGSTEIIEQVLVKVNGDILTKTDLEAKQIAALRDRIKSNVDADALKNDDTLKRMLAEVTPQILVQTIDEMLQLQMAKEKGYKITDQQFKEWLADIRKGQGLEEDAKFQAALKSEGMTMDDLRRNFEKQVMIYRIQSDEVGAKLQITEEEARQYYLAHKQEFVEPATVTLREIFIEVPTATQGGQQGVNVAQEDAMKARADAVHARLAAGEDFATVAQEVSTSASKSSGGLIGTIQMSQLSQPLQDVLGKMKAGEITSPIRTARGFQILKVDGITTPTVQPFESVRDMAADKLFASRQGAEVQKFLSKLRSQAIIVWKNEELKKAYEQQIASQTPTQH
jgi:parvulin-like peptidyl-prolyl isomerase